jgi:hypothetical protein
MQDRLRPQWSTVELAEHQIAGHPEFRLPAGLALEGRDDASGQSDSSMARLRLRDVMTGLVLRILDNV